MTLSLSSIIKANEQEVAAKVMDGEAILINLATGAYYSSPSTGGFIWSLVEHGHSMRSIVAHVVARYAVARERAEADVARIVEAFVAEGLAVAQDSDANEDTVVPETMERLPYDEPKMEKYTDMAEMFALDPPLPGLAKKG